MDIKRRGVLQGAVAVGATLFAGPSLASVLRDQKGDPEPLQHFHGFAEGFYGYRNFVYYMDSNEAAWAPRSLDPRHLRPIDLSAADLWDLLGRLRKRHWSWTVEHAVLNRLPAQRELALRLLATAVAFERPAALRLQHLTSAITRGRDTWHAVGTDGRAFPTRLAAR